MYFLLQKVFLDFWFLSNMRSQYTLKTKIEKHIWPFLAVSCYYSTEILLDLVFKRIEMMQVPMGGTTFEIVQSDRQQCKTLIYGSLLGVPGSNNL